MTDPNLENALRQMEVAASSFALRLARSAEIRAEYVQRIHSMSQEIRDAVASGNLSARKGAEMAHQMRNQIMEMQRLRDFDLGRSLAQRMKAKGITLEQVIDRAMRKLGLEGKPFNQLSGAEQRRVLNEVIDGAGRSRPAVTGKIPKLRWASRGLWLATLLIAGYNIGTSENPWWQTGRESAGIAGGVGGGFVGGAAMGAAGGVWAGPLGVAVGIIVGGVLGSLMADHAYIELAGVSDPGTRAFIDRFTSFLTGTDEAGIAKALAREHASRPGFITAVLRSLDDSYTTDADDVAFELVELARHDAQLAQVLRANPGLRQILIQLLDDGWTTGAEQNAIRFLNGR